MSDLIHELGFYAVKKKWPKGLEEMPDILKRAAAALSEAEQRAKRDAREEAAILAGSIGDEQIRSGSLDLDASVDKIIVAIRALIPSEPHDAEGRE